MKPMSRIQSFWQMGVLRNEKPCSHWTFSSAATRKVTVTGFGVILLCVPTWTYIPRRNGSFAVRDWQNVTHCGRCAQSPLTYAGYDVPATYFSRAEFDAYGTLDHCTTLNKMASSTSSSMSSTSSSCSTLNAPSTKPN